MMITEFVAAAVLDQLPFICGFICGNIFVPAAATKCSFYNFLQYFYMVLFILKSLQRKKHYTGLVNRFNPKHFFISYQEVVRHRSCQGFESKWMLGFFLFLLAFEVKCSSNRLLTKIHHC